MVGILAGAACALVIAILKIYKWKWLLESGAIREEAFPWIGGGIVLMALLAVWCMRPRNSS